MAINLSESLNFEDRVELAMSTKSHTKKLDLLKSIKKDIEFDIAEGLQMAQILSMTKSETEDNISGITNAVDNITKLSEQNKWLSGEILKEENAIAEYDYNRKHHPVVTASKNIVKGVEDGVADMKVSSDEIKDKLKSMSKKKQKSVVVEEFSVEDDPIINTTMSEVLVDATAGPEPEPAM